MQLNHREIEAISAIYDQLTDPGNWQTALDKIAWAVGADSAMLVVMDQTDPVFNTQALSSGLDPEKYQQNSIHVWPYEQAVAIPAILGSEPRTLIYPHECWPAEEYQQLHSVNWLRDVMGIYHRCCMRLNAQESWFDNLIVNHNSLDQGLDVHGQQSMFNLAPHLAKAIQIQRPFLMLKHKFNAVLAALDKLRVGVMVLNSQNRVLLNNLEAQRILESHPALRLDARQQLRASDGEEELQLQQLLSQTQATARQEHHGDGGVLAFKARDQYQHLILECSPFVDNLAEMQGEIPGVLVYLVDVENNYLESVKHLNRAYNLPKAEADVAELVARGLSNHEIAELRNVSLNTVKMQLKSLFQKTRCNSRVELVRLATAIAPPLYDHSPVDK
ncbi:helix-turn-helix transcriptional regulator [Bacterioplanoides sp.]|uniref:helix-turn-helix transcriptional regulator n=1 Tax=Bacterioplanoides sp. TaxID=2066072 RepID=UPI003B5CABA5